MHEDCKKLAHTETFLSKLFFFQDSPDRFDVTDEILA
jgi:hypothetical protein